MFCFDGDVPLMSIYAPPDISTYGDTSDGVALTFLFISTPGFIST